MAKGNKKYPWDGKVINSAQIGGIETSTLDNGPGKGCRIAWINTGAGLRYKVVIDRAMDIVDAFYGDLSLTWLSLTGITTPKDCGKFAWLETFAGGLVTTCGLTHIGAPEEDKSGSRTMHGRISNMAAELVSIDQPDVVNGKLDMSITGIVRQAGMFGPNLELRRTISAQVGQPTIKISDVVTNRGNNKVPHMILYHINFGWPLVDKGTDIVWKGTFKPLGREMDLDIFNNKVNYKKFPGVLKKHTGSGESVAMLDVRQDKKGLCRVGLANKKLNLAVMIEYQKKQLPWLTNWQHAGHGEYVTALEPGTNAPIGQAEAKKRKELIVLGPKESKKYEVSISVLSDKKQIDKFIKTSG